MLTVNTSLLTKKLAELLLFGVTGTRYALDVIQIQPEIRFPVYFSKAIEQVKQLINHFVESRYHEFKLLLNELETHWQQEQAILNDLFADHKELVNEQWYCELGIELIAEIKTLSNG